MTGTLSGGLVYQFFEGPNRYGLVKLEEDGVTLTRLGDFNNLKSRLSRCTTEPETHDWWTTDEMVAQHRPVTPQMSTSWRADTTIPDSPVNWDAIADWLEDRSWVDVGEDDNDKSVVTLADHFKNLRLEG